MANKNRSVYNVDEDALKRMVAGDTTALEKIRKQDERPEEDAGPPECWKKKKRNRMFPLRRNRSRGRKHRGHTALMITGNNSCNRN